MKKLLLTAILLSLLVLVGCAKSPTGAIVFEGGGDVELKISGSVESLNLTLAEDGNETEEEDPVSVAQITNLKFRLRLSQISLEGIIIDSLTGEPIEDANIRLYCDGDERSSGGVNTTSTGSFFISGGCSGEEVWVEVDYNGETYESKHFKVPRGSGGGKGGGSGGGGGGSFLPLSADPEPEDPSIPEFSSISAILALVGAGAFYLKKRKKAL